MEDEQPEKRTRGKGKGSNFFALAHDVWEKLCTVPTTNRMNLLITYLVLLAGTGSDHRLTKWSAKACEQYTGLGKPRAKHAIAELIDAGLVRHTDASTRMMPQYELPTLPTDAEPIFLPVALVTGLETENPMLRRVRETGDPLLLCMLIDLYGLVTTDATHAVGIKHIHSGLLENSAPTTRKVTDTGAHAIWAITKGTWRKTSGDWYKKHRTTGPKPYDEFWRRFDLLVQIGAVWWEPWLYDGEGEDAEPIIPLDFSGFYDLTTATDEAKLTRLAFDVSRAILTPEREYMLQGPGDFYVPLAVHRRQPAYREVLKMRVEADTPGRRWAWKQRRTLIEQYTQGFDQVHRDVEAGIFNQPMRLQSGAPL
ncbi:hypothetical protein [Rhizorhabdus histidinilytica]|uniref:hypothetical protein n=1 Tax=Rhizorhabdus histidinilytica TaxID=439228 RepID=UPI0032207DFF